jgi:hypothetical protein
MANRETSGADTAGRWGMMTMMMVRMLNQESKKIGLTNAGWYQVLA